jgi:hypothetical protein
MRPVGKQHTGSECWSLRVNTVGTSRIDIAVAHRPSLGAQELARMPAGRQSGADGRVEAYAGNGMDEIPRQADVPACLSMVSFAQAIRAAG